MAYFADGLAHSTTLGVALALLLAFDTGIGILLLCLMFAILLVWLQQQRILALDTLIGVLAHAGLALGLVLIELLDKHHFDLHHFLLGNILRVSPINALFLCLSAAVVLFLLWRNWEKLLLTALDEDAAAAEGVDTLRANVLLFMTMALTVAVAIQIVGILMVTALMIIPAASAKLFARTPEQMLLASILLCLIGILAGGGAAIQLQLPSGPAIVSVMTLLFTIVLAATALRSRHNRRRAETSARGEDRV